MKIGMYTEHEIFEFMTDEGGFLGRSMYDAIFDKIHALITENQQLEDRINKAIHYINTHALDFDDGRWCLELTELQLNELMKILKGDKE